MKTDTEMMAQSQLNRGLYEAVLQKNAALAQSALLSGANPNAITQRGLPLVVACAAGDIACVKILLKARADPNLEDDRGENPFMQAARQNHGDIVRLLAKAGAIIDSEDIDNCTPLHYAAMKGADAVISALVDLKADINKKDRQQMTPLAYAARGGKVDSVALLLSLGASIDIEDEFSSTALSRACRNGHSDVACILLAAGANPCVRDNECLESAMEQNDIKLFALLLQYGADAQEIDGAAHPRFQKLIDIDRQQKSEEAKAERKAAFDKISHQGLPTRVKIQKPIKLKLKNLSQP